MYIYPFRGKKSNNIICGSAIETWVIHWESHITNMTGKATGLDDSLGKLRGQYDIFGKVEGAILIPQGKLESQAGISIL